jgi:hypothetical protein
MIASAVRVIREDRAARQDVTDVRVSQKQRLCGL